MTLILVELHVRRNLGVLPDKARTYEARDEADNPREPRQKDGVRLTDFPRKSGAASGSLGFRWGVLGKGFKRVNLQLFFAKISGSTPCSRFIMSGSVELQRGGLPVLVPGP